VIKSGKKNIIIEIICAVFILLWTYSGLTKYIEHEKFITALKASSAIAASAGIISWIIPSIELLAAFFLLFPAFRGIGMQLTSIMIISFTLYVGYMLLFISDLPCSCGGVIEKMSWKTHLWFNTGLSGLSLWGIQLLRNNKDLIAINKTRTGRS
jgi:hypothetical protein